MATPARESFPCIYEIRIQGTLGECWLDWFDRMELVAEPIAGARATTLLRGLVEDRAALYGMLSRVRDLGLVLLSVGRIESGP